MASKPSSGRSVGFILPTESSTSKSSRKSKIKSRRRSNLWDVYHQGETSEDPGNEPLSITTEKWLPLYGSQGSLSMLLKYLTLDQHMALLPLEQAITKPDRTYYGFICLCNKPIPKLEEDKFPASSQICTEKNLYPKSIINAGLTLDLLNMWLCGKHIVNAPKAGETLSQIDEKLKQTPTNSALETYLAGLFGHNDDNVDFSEHLAISTPIAFAHNFVAREILKLYKSPLNKENRALSKEPEQHSYCFVIVSPGSTEEVKSPTLAYITKSGDLVRMKESQSEMALAIKEFVEFLAPMVNVAIGSTLAVVLNELAGLKSELEAFQASLNLLASDDSSRRSSLSAPTRLSTSAHKLSFEELDELSALSDQFDAAEDFQLCVQEQNSIESPKKLNDSSLDAKAKEIRNVEKRIRDLAKQIALIKQEQKVLGYAEDDEEDLDASVCEKNEEKARALGHKETRKSKRLAHLPPSQPTGIAPESKKKKTSC
ncbi:hypothetical protein DdX_12230 [Ditylenchus destructor]|uniref:Uncharacterized protein n=1 Tax=Ditylenchus destructor TaxID=166010 RepID=A0AAD4MXB3_9BILA|nr:hypothetical protein DdX_12230 [Ditylenchus destructor]